MLRCSRRRSWVISPSGGSTSSIGVAPDIAIAAARHQALEDIDEDVGFHLAVIGEQRRSEDRC